MGAFQIWGHKTVSFLDVWSIEHLVMGVSIGAFCIKLSEWVLTKRFSEDHCQTLRGLVAVLFLLMMAFYWEMLEHYLEQGLAGEVIQRWFAGVEHWSNRLVSDIVIVVLGYFLCVRYRWLEWPARAFTALWLGVHIFIFPHSMYLHEIMWP